MKLKTILTTLSITILAAVPVISISCKNENNTNNLDDKPLNTSSSSNNDTNSETNNNSNSATNFVKFIYTKSDYYKSLEGKKGQELFKAIQSLQKSKTGGIGSYADLYETYKTAFVDKYYEKDGTILDIYSANPNGKDPYEFKMGMWDGKGSRGTRGNGNAESHMYNREHVIPQSWFGKRQPTRNDAHFVWPTDKYVNNRRGSFPHGKVSKGWTSKNGTKVGNNNAEPIDAFKGDVVRAYFYFQATHHNAGNRANLTTSFPYFTPNYLTLYRIWDKKDPIDQFDIDRNNAVAEAQGGIRNPFSDYPELPDLIWGQSNNTFHNKGILTGINTK